MFRQVFFQTILILITNIVIASNYCKVSYKIGSEVKSKIIDAGETCQSIAHVLNITVEDLECYNAPHLDCNNLASLESLCLDCYYRIENCPNRGSNNASCMKKITVSSGDSCYTIASTYGINIQKLEALNSGLHCDSSYIFPGQIICVE